LRKFGGALRSVASWEGDRVAHLEADCIGGLCTNGKCFAAGTPVATANGPKPIEQIRAGDTVLTRDSATG
jgi:hypothetical protein